MSILKNSNSGRSKKLTPTYILTFGYTAGSKEHPDWFIKDHNHHLTYNDSVEKFVLRYRTKLGAGLDSMLWDYEFDTVDQLYIVEKWWFGKTKQERDEAFAEIKKYAKRAFDFFGAAKNIFAKTISSDLISVQPLEEPKSTISWFDGPLEKIKGVQTETEKSFNVKSYIDSWVKKLY